MDLGFRMHAERTPNPDSIKWVLGQSVTGDDPSAVFDEPVGEDVSPLAAKLLGIAGVAAVFLGPNFITVTRAQGREWTDLAPPIVDAIKTWAGRRSSSTINSANWVWNSGVPTAMIEFVASSSVKT